jgi:hypothetical protein
MGLKGLLFGGCDDDGPSLLLLGGCIPRDGTAALLSSQPQVCLPPPRSTRV